VHDTGARLTTVSHRRVPTGALATAVFGLSLRDSSLIILFFAILTSLPPAFMGIGGCKTGMRQIIQARYSFG
jgi:purine-cytosine permease-like protein